MTEGIEQRHTITPGFEGELRGNYQCELPANININDSNKVIEYLRRNFTIPANAELIIDGYGQPRRSLPEYAVSRIALVMFEVK